jgi:tetratricopeptide (TPR) repeat protein
MTSAIPGSLTLDPALVVDASTLQRLAMELRIVVDEDPRRGAERIAAAEAHLRLVVTGAAKDKATQLLDRAIDLDPYRAGTYLVAAVTAHRDGRLVVALERYEQAAALAPSNVEARFHGGFGFLDAARRSALSDEDATELAEVASSHFEAALALDPTHVPAALGAIESALYGKATKLRDTLGGLLARVAPAEALRPTMTRLLLQAIFAFRVGKAKNVDQKNTKTIGEIAAVARGWLAAFPGDPGLLGVVAAAAAKCATAEELCDNLAEHARAIPDVRVLRMLLRERLADVADLQKRLSLFEGAMKRIPLLDGLAHDYLQLLHLVAKRAAAEGDVKAARDAWRSCQELDPRSPATTQNLLRVALHEGDAQEVARLERWLGELWTLYAELSPRPDGVLRRAAARAQIDVDAELEQIVSGAREDKRPSCAQMINLVHRWARAQALGRLAVEPALLAVGGLDFAKKLLVLEPDDAFAFARQVLALPVAGRVPAAYAVIGLSKDATAEEITKAREEWREGLLREMQTERAEGGSVDSYEQYLQRAIAATRVLVDPVARAAYDASTCPTPRTEFYRRHMGSYVQLVELSLGVGELEKFGARQRLAGLLAEVPRVILAPYLGVLLRDETWLDIALLRVRYLGLVQQGWKLLNDGELDKALDLCARSLAHAGRLASVNRLQVFAALNDPNAGAWDAAMRAHHYAREALRVAHWSDLTVGIVEMRRYAAHSLETLAQHAASARARTCLEKERTNDAVLLLWSAYTHAHQKRHAPTTSPVAALFANLEPSGTGFYAFTVAQALRSNVINWYNRASPRSQYEVDELKRRAFSLARVATAWARYARDTISEDPIRAEAAPQIAPAIANLLKILKKDEGSLSS